MLNSSQIGVIWRYWHVLRRMWQARWRKRQFALNGQGNVLTKVSKELRQHLADVHKSDHKPLQHPTMALRYRAALSEFRSSYIKASGTRAAFDAIRGLIERIELSSSVDPGSGNKQLTVKWHRLFECRAELSNGDRYRRC
jgi:hypothetical protein